MADQLSSCQLRLMARLGLAKGDIKLLHVVQGLGDYLTSEDDDLRNKGKTIKNFLLVC